jgi:hypothetical protein
LKPEDILTDDEIKFMTSHQPKYFDTVNKNLNEVYLHERNKYEMNVKLIAKQTEQRKTVADSYNEVNHKAQSESFYSTDEMVYANAVDYWTPDQSTILQAHQNNVTLKMFNEYMQSVSKGKQFIQGQMVNIEGPEMNRQDIDHFRSDLVYAGYKPDSFTFKKDPSGIYKFVRNESVPLERDPTQIAEVSYLRATEGDEYINNLINSDGSLSTKLNSLMKQNENLNNNNFIQLNKHEHTVVAAQKYNLSVNDYNNVKMYTQRHNIKINSDEDFIAAKQMYNANTQRYENLQHMGTTKVIQETGDRVKTIEVEQAAA